MVSDEKLFRIAIDYYKNGKTQSDIAQELGVSHVQVGKYLKLAMERGIVEITINPPFVEKDEKEKYSHYLREWFNLQNLVLVPSAAGQHQTDRFLIEGASEYLLKKFPNKTLNIGFGLGRTTTELSAYKTKTVDKRPLWTVYPITNYNHHFGLSESGDSYFSYKVITENFSNNWNTKIDRNFMTTIKSDSVEQVSTYWTHLDAIVGGVGIPVSRDPEARKALFGEEEANNLSKMDVSGDYLNYFFDDEGHILKSANLSRTAISLSEMKAVPERIAVACGFQKVYSIIALLRCDIINTLVTDLATAKNIVEMLK